MSVAVPLAPEPKSPEEPPAAPGSPIVPPAPAINGPGSVPPVENTSKRSASKFLNNEGKEEDYLQSLKTQATEIFKVKGPLCDSEGFYQHSGECWNDAIQQIFCNADGIKENMQGVYIFWNFPTSYWKELPDWAFVPSYQRGPLTYNYWVSTHGPWIEEMKKWFLLYVRESQKRFLRHYLLETKRRNVKQELCAIQGQELGPLAREKLMAISRDPTYRKKGLEAQRAAIFGTSENMRMEGLRPSFTVERMSKPTRETYVAKQESLAGGTDVDEDSIMELYNSLFFRNQLTITVMDLATLRYQVLDIPAFKSNLNKTTGVFLAIKKITEKKTSGHAMAFYQCGNQELFYEDNYGIFPFEWRDYFANYVELTNQNVEPKMQFAKLHAVNKAQKIFYYSPFYPVLSYTDREGKYHTVLMVGGETFEANDGSQQVLSFKTVIDGTSIKLDYNANDIWEFRRAVFLQPSASTAVTNTSFELNSVSRIGLNPILRAILENDSEAALEAIEIEPVEPNLTLRVEDGRAIPVLVLALNHKLVDVAVKLIEKGYDYKAEYNKISVLYRAANSNYVSVVRAFLQKDPSLLEFENPYGRSLLSVSAMDDDTLDVTKLLLELGANIESKSHLGRTPLFFAARDDAPETVKYLCSKGANPTVVDNGDPTENLPPRTPIDAAKTPEIKEFLTNQCGKKGGRRAYRNTKKTSKKRKSKKTRKQSS